jgi:hypothetical protein
MNTYTIERDGLDFTVTIAGEPGAGGHIITHFPSEGAVRDWLKGHYGIDAGDPLPVGESHSF